MKAEVLSIMSNALEHIAAISNKTRTPQISSLSNEKVVENLLKSSEYEHYAKNNLINSLQLMINNDKNLVYSQIANLSTLSIKELKALWQEKMGKNPPTKRKTLVERLAYHIQELAFGGMSSNAKETLNIYKERFLKGEPLLGSSKNYELIPGIILTREYNGKKYSVKILEDEKIEYKGQVYKSLSAVAREITGVRWNGPKFFHLEKR